MRSNLTPEDEALLQWSGELDGDPPEDTRRELDALAASLQELPSPPVPTRALDEALRRHRQGRETPRGQIALNVVIPLMKIALTTTGTTCRLYVRN